MQLHTLLAIIAPAIATVQAGCFGSGPTWDPTKNTAVSVVDQICNSNGVSGFFTSGQTKSRCVNIRDHVRAQFEAQWTGGGSLSLNDGDCKLRLKNEINGCSHGGETITAQWRFK
ncbi:hypothetical protein K505DRAFT_244834 [Melanomma pulvis-pyrius CBS 109.77]|uniref:Ecp2 effector protein domain-containing protein n=1 Tax=Melanomma pulvis-pyrius CBS 109.77 TaxID=1314802 RepID=A0A6A6XC13_9PLEO|nr:hypothetical protein K505DRAFT_244834 [Melanomma pulvis-pyrius CBS 109.77]